jgi:DNA-binding winged helix-turn-helix (wHTH) protein
VPEVLNNPRTSAEPSLKAPPGDLVRFGPFVFDRVNGLLWRNGVELALPPRAIGVLARLVERAGDVVSKAELLDRVWKDTYVTEVSLTEAISLLRQTLDDDPQRPVYIQTQPRRGYRFIAPLEEAQAPARAPAAAAPAVTVTGETVTVSAPQVTVIGGENADALWPTWLPWVVSGVALLALITVSTGLLRQPSLRERPVARFAIDPGAGVTPLVGEGPALAVSRDGARIAFVAQRADGRSRLYVRELGRLETAPIPETDEARAPFFSPDGRWLGFFARGRLFKVALSGGAPVALADAPDPGGAVWTATGAIIFSGWTTGGLRRVGDRGGPAELLTTPDPGVGEVRHAWPELTDGDRNVIFTGLGADAAPESARLAVLIGASGAIRTLIDGASFGRVLNTGHLLFVRERRVFAAPFDADALVIQGPPVPVLDGVAADARGVAQHAVTSAGVLAQVTADEDDRPRDAWRLGASSAPVALPFDAAAIRSLVAAPDGRLAAAALGDGHRSDIWIGRIDASDRDPRESAGSRRWRLTTEGHNAHPVWTPDGGALIYARRMEGAFEIVARALNGETPAMRLVASARNVLPSSVSRDNGLFYTQVEHATGMDIWRVSLRTTPGQITAASTPAPIVQAPGDQTEAAPSPDGRWLAWQSNVSGAWRAVARDLQAMPGADIDLGPSTGDRLYWADAGTLAFASSAATTAVCRLGLAPHPGPLPASEEREAARSDCVASAPADVFRSLPGAALWRLPPTQERTRLEVVLEWTKELSAKVPTQPKEVRPVR